MNLSPAELEQAVVEALTGLLSGYSQIDQLTDTMLHKQSQGLSIEEELKSLEQVKLQVGTLEQSTLPVRNLYRESNSQASANVKALTDQAMAVLQQVMSKVDQLEQTARTAHEKLAPTINQSVRVNQMHQAYGRS